jgi:hypothetical protein
MEIKYPQFIRVDAYIKEQYLDPLKGKGLFSESEATDIYFISASLGVKYALKKESKKQADLRLYSTLQPKYQSLIRIIALKDSNFDYNILSDGKKMLKIIESYANGGASMLHDKILKGNGLDFSLEDEIWEELNRKNF